MLHQKIFFKDLLDHCSSKSTFLEKVDIKLLSRLSEVSIDDGAVSYTHLTLPTKA